MKRAIIFNLLFFTLYASIMAQPLKSFTRDDLKIVENGNLGGTTRHVGLIRESAIAEIPLVDPGTRTISTPIAFVDETLEVFAKIPITKDSGDVRNELQGEMDGRSFMNFIDFRVATGNDKNLELAARLCNEYVIGVAQDKQGRWRLLGNLLIPAHLSQATGQTGKAGADNNNISYILQADDIGPAPIMVNPPQFEVTV